MRTRLRTTGLALLALSAIVVAGCGNDDGDKAQEQASSAISQGQAIQSQALSQAGELQSQAAEIQSQALSQAAELTQDLGALTEDVPDLESIEEPATTAAETTEATEATETTAMTEPAATEAPADTAAASADLIDPAALKAALEQAVGLTLTELPGGAAGQGMAFSNQATMIQDGQAVFAYVLSDPQAAELFSSVVPQMPGVEGQSTTVAHKNAIVVYASFGGTDHSKDVEAAVNGL